MQYQNPRSTALANDDRVVVIGGGPAGSFFAIQLLRGARRLGRYLDVIIVEKRGPVDMGPEGLQCRGCNFCAGVISPRLHQTLSENGLVVPDEVIQARFDYLWIHGQWKNFRLRVPKDMQMYSVFRGSLPSRRKGRPAGFDGFLLGEAIQEGARVICGDVEGLRYSPEGMARVAVRTEPEVRIDLDAAFVAVATGINARCSCGHDEDPLVASLRRMNARFVPGKSRKALIFELDVGYDYVAHNLHQELYFIEYGSKRLSIEHAAIVPKGRFVTVAIIGKCIDDAALPRESQEIARAFLELPQIGRILPGVQRAPLACVCFPQMSTTTAECPFGARFAVIGDAVGARLNKDGLFSAHLTASKLAHTVLHEGTDERALERGYAGAILWLAADNRFGRIVFGLSRLAFTRPVIGRIMYQAFATEYRARDQQRRPLTAVLWKIASGTADYRDVLQGMCGSGVLRSLLTAAAATLRNVVLEMFFGLRWRHYGRYPTVVLKERRTALRERLEASLGVPLGKRHDFERMFVIKIRASEREIMDELGEFGGPDATFLKLRFLEIRRVRGTANEVGSTIRYGLRIGGPGAELTLTTKTGSEALLYQFDERLANNGKLIFHIASTKDGNSRLSIYAAFDFKKGDGIFTRALWKVITALFPAFVHDIVWNHALCIIKEEVERRHFERNEAPQVHCAARQGM